MNKVALITGGAKRIGLEIAKLLWSEDWDLIIHYRSSQPEAELFANEMNEQRENSVQLIQADLDNAEDVKRLMPRPSNGIQELMLLSIMPPHSSLPRLGK